MLHRIRLNSGSIKWIIGGALVAMQFVLAGEITLAQDTPTVIAKNASKVPTFNIEQLGVVFANAINSQGMSKRIGIYREDSNDSYYAIQGMYGLEFDRRVTKSVKFSDYDSESKEEKGELSNDIPRYAIHFTRGEIARSIYSNAKTTSHRKRSNGKELVPGAICRFDRVIHAITDIRHTENGFVIAPRLKDIRSRMVHGISDENVRPKYESGLVFDVKALAKYYEDNGIVNAILINEIGTLLVHDDIPHECIVTLIDGEDEIDKFWSGN